ncbi:hypothetical protein H2198_006522 [Neophaeococcomyces mojaviensis]|uniref:Uncharacterized protein n=1 Tax=Neophaeococcomyces mojaviensis TaxID=3383035 RepID=A0ACC3A3D1_9EURO|nr:hypothetical protein H2198_006522 [Knufia sp. JES_112]
MRWTKGSPSQHQFEALSYTWGSKENPGRVFVGPDSRPLSVTRNLAHALVHLRYPDKPRTLWIDAICVNQSDMHERGSQVKRMADIYKNAYRVVVWLGPGTQQSAQAMQILHVIALAVIINRDSFRIEGSRHPPSVRSDEQYLEHCGDPGKPFNFHMSQFDCVGQLLNRSWFERLWIWQEIRFAASTSVIQCGSETMLWNEFRDAIYALFFKSVSFHNVPDLCNFEQALSAFVSRLQLIFQLCELQNEDFTSLTDTTMTAKCADKRDRIYALLSLLDAAGSELRVEPDYTKSVFEVYREVSLRMLLDSHELKILCRVELQSEHNWSGNWSSWVPDWSTPRLTTPLQDKFASGSSCPEISHHDHVIHVTGVAVAKILDHCEFAHSSLSNQDASVDTEAEMTDNEKKLFRVLKHLCPQRDLTVEGMDSLCRTLVAGAFKHDLDPPSSANISFEDAKKALDAWVQMRFQDLPCLNATGQWRRYLQSMSVHCTARTVFKSPTGHFGIAPRTAKKDDIVVVFLGCPSPLVLRPTGSYFQIVGEAYCDGYMNCEALLGPLPTGVQVLRQQAAGTAFVYWAYRNTATGETQIEDPRLGPLPEGWAKHEHKYDHFLNRYVNMSIDKSIHAQDPRLTAPCLRERGTHLRVFEII